jgi:hypothetical protein
MTKPLKAESGMAMLESAFIFILLGFMLLGGVVTAERFKQFGAATRLVERYVHEDVFRPLSLASTGSGEYAIVVKHSQLRNHLESNLTKIEEEISTLLSSQRLELSYFIESSYAVIPINQATGEVSGDLSNFTCVVRSGQSGLADPTCGNLRASFMLHAQQTLSQQLNRAAFAIPSVRANREGAAGRYLPFAVIVGLRVGWLLPSGFSGDVGELIGLSRQVADQKVAVLRGDIEL